jgi:6-phosphogluconolactonase/glucosamine-6-phosphate isomerase/deaminase
MSQFIRFIKTTTTETPAAYIAGLVNGCLQADKKVLLLLSGGSSIAVAAAAYKLLNDQSVDGLTIMLTDERYGDVGHADSNWRQLELAGLPVNALPNALPVLIGENMDITTSRYNTLLEEQMTAAGAVIGMFGMGTDGHTAGILPATPAIGAEGWAVGYNTTEYRRITMTFRAIRHVTTAVLCASGEAKLAPLTALQTKTAPLIVQPVQVLKEVPSLVVFTDLLGDPL